MSRRERKTEKRNHSSSLIEEARKRIFEVGESKRSVASSLGIPESTLRKYLKSDSLPSKLGRYATTFPREIEDELCQHIKKIDSMFYGITAKSLRILAYDFAVKSGIPHRFNNDSKIAGKDWLRGFLKRHPDLSVRQPTSTSIARAIGLLIKASKTYKEPEKTPRKKVWKCGLCNEVYKEPVQEDWLGCAKCEEWWHEKCTDYVGIGAFVCDRCVK